MLVGKVSKVSKVLDRERWVLEIFRTWVLGNALPWLVGLFLGPDLKGGGDQGDYLLPPLGH